MVEHPIAGGIGTKSTAVNLEGTQYLVERHVEKVLAVIRPGGAAIGKKVAGRIGNGLRVEISSGEILEKDGELFRAVEVDGVRQLPPIRADRKHTHAAEVLAFGECILVQQDFFRLIH